MASASTHPIASSTPSPSSYPTSSSLTHRQQQEANSSSSEHGDGDVLSDITSPCYQPYPSPALSAYSCSSETTDFESDYDSEIASLSLEESGWSGQQELRHQPHRQPDLEHHSRLSSGQRTEGTSTPRPNQSRRSSIFQPDISSAATNLDHSFRGRQHGKHPASPSNHSTPSPRTSQARDSGHAANSYEQDLDRSQGSGRPDEDGEAQAETGENSPDEFDQQDQDEDDMHAEGVPAARGWRLDARKSDERGFRVTVLSLFSQQLKLVGWSQETTDPRLWPLDPDRLRLKRISGAFTNAVFFASYDTGVETTEKIPPPPTVLLRVYGSGSEVLLSRRAELLILHTLSSLYEIGPHILGTFANGRVEEFYECEPIQKHGMRDLGDREAHIGKGGSLVVRGREGKAQWVARRMNELHAVPLDVMKTVLEQGDLKGPSEKGFGRGIENHIMASSHRPRRRKMRTPGQAPPFFANALDPNSRNLMRDSPAPMGPGEQAKETSFAASAVSGVVAMQGYSSHRNSSVASFDSLATSYNSQSSFSGSGSSEPQSLNEKSPAFGPASSLTNASSYFPPGARAPSSPLALAPRGSDPASSGRSGAKPSGNNGARGPYPGVWRRIKRWSREAAKIVALVDQFCSSDEGKKACEIALRGHPVEDLTKLTSSEIGPTNWSLRNMLLCIASINLGQVVKEMDEFKSFVRRWERSEGQSKRVFAHNDAQYGNLLALQTSKAGGSSGDAGNLNPSNLTGDEDEPALPQGMPRGDKRRGSSVMDSPSVGPLANFRSSVTSERGGRSGSQTRSKSKGRTRNQPPHHGLVVIDFEYASPNPRGYDIANHFQEWRTDYHHPTHSWSLTHHGAYPNESERRRWLRAYVEQGRLVKLRASGSSKMSGLELPTPSEMALPPPAIESSNASLTIGGKAGYRVGAPRDGTETRAAASEEEKSELKARSMGMGALEKSNGSSASRMSSTRETSISSIDSVLESKSGKVWGGAESTTSDSTASGSAAATSRSTQSHSSSWTSHASSPTFLPCSLNGAAVHVEGQPTSSAGAGTGSGSEPTLSPSTWALARLDASIEREIDRLEKEIKVWSPATHAVWALWGIVFAKEAIENVISQARLEVSHPSPPDGPPSSACFSSVLHDEDQGDEMRPVMTAGCSESFDNLRYALGRFELFRSEFKRLREEWEVNTGTGGRDLIRH
ncbi:kinase-like protein [Violaceomyces palustris]|uniref:Kinase-like protein n=1 Tax=Violaceomyces palustris TaxID=1673888 RepID=A0ACD0P356_9BASI|nr:kinase-like protein [Violaceomyces palustris]